MSRCFPYPPPGFVKKAVGDEALIEPIKLQEEAEKAKKEKKREKKREKKEKKARENGEIGDKKHHHKKGNKDERQQEDEKVRDHGQKREREIQDMSTLTEEHPVGSQNSSDSTLNSNNSNKRQKQNLSPECRQNTGKIVRIRLPINSFRTIEPLQRHKDQDVPPREEIPSRLPPCVNIAPPEQPSRLLIQKANVPEKLPSQLPLQSNKEGQAFRLPVQRTNAPDVTPIEKLSSRLPVKRNKDTAVLPKEEQPCRLPLQRNKHPVVVPKEEQPCKLPQKTQKEPVLVREKQPSLKRQMEQEVLTKEKKTCLSLQRTKDLEVPLREKQQARQLPLQRAKDPEVLLPWEKQDPSQLSVQPKREKKVVAREEQLCQLPPQRNNDPAVSREAKPSQLPVQKQKAPEVLGEEQLCSVSGRTADLSVQGRSEPVPEQEKVDRSGSTSKTESKEERKSRRRASQYRELFEKWIEPPILPCLLPTDSDDDQGWLLKTNKNENCGVEKHVGAAIESLSCGDSVSWPRARLLPEVDTYALPFTVPF